MLKKTKFIFLALFSISVLSFGIYSCNKDYTLPLLQEDKSIVATTDAKSKTVFKDSKLLESEMKKVTLGVLKSERNNEGELLFQSVTADKLGKGEMKIEKTGVNTYYLIYKIKFGDRVITSAKSLKSINQDNGTVGFKLPGDGDGGETHSCSGQNCDGCGFLKDKTGGIVGCECNIAGTGTGTARCNHTVTTSN